jgi:hypothetical protein
MSAMETISSPCRYLFYQKLDAQINLPLYLVLIKIAWKKTDTPASFPKIVTGTVDFKEIIKEF